MDPAWWSLAAYIAPGPFLRGRGRSQSRLTPRGGPVPRPALILAVAGLGLALAAPSARAQGTPVPAAAPAVDAGAFKVGDAGLSASADLAYVLTAGNARASSLGF